MRCAWCYAARSCSHRHSAVLPVSVRPVQLDNGSGGEGKQDDAAQTRAPRAPRAPVNRHSRQNKKAQRTAEAFSLCLIATRRLAVLYACFYFTTSMNQRQIDHAAFADLACVRQRPSSCKRTSRTFHAWSRSSGVKDMVTFIPASPGGHSGEWWF